MTWIEPLYLLTLILFFSGGATALILQSLIRQRLRRRHLDTWTDLDSRGHPWSSGRSQRRLNSFLRSGDYKSLADPVLNRLAAFLRLIAWCLVAGLSILATIFLWVLIES